MIDQTHENFLGTLVLELSSREKTNGQQRSGRKFRHHIYLSLSLVAIWTQKSRPIMLWYDFTLHFTIFKVYFPNIVKFDLLPPHTPQTIIIMNSLDYNVLLMKYLNIESQQPNPHIPQKWTLSSYLTYEDHNKIHQSIYVSFEAPFHSTIFKNCPKFAYWVRALCACF